MISIILGLILFIISIPIKTMQLAVTTTKAFQQLTDDSQKKEKREPKTALGKRISRKKKAFLAKKEKSDSKPKDSKSKKTTKKAVETIKKVSKIAVKLSIKAIKLVAFALQMIAMFLTTFGILSCTLVCLVVTFLVGAVGYVAVVMNKDSLGNYSGISSGTNTEQTTPATPVVAADWKIVSQGDYSDVAYSDSDVAECGCGLCSIYVVSEHYSGNKDTFTVQSCASEVNEKYPSNGTNINRAVVTEWFNTMHPELGLTCEGDKDGDIDLDALDATLANGGCAIVDYHDDVKYNGTSVWTSGGHYVTIISGNQNDGYMVRDSNGGHEHGTRGIAEWAPYSTHVFEKEYIQGAFYYYLLEKN